MNASSADPRPLADERVALDLAVGADLGSALDLHEGADLAPGADPAPVDVGEGAHHDVISELDFDDEAIGGAVGRL